MYIKLVHTKSSHKKTLFFIIFIVFTTTYCLGQSLEVNLRLKNNETPLGATIRLIDFETENLVDYRILEDSINCLFKEVKYGRYEVKVDFFGYKDTIHRIEVKENKPYKLHFILIPIDYELPSVSIIDKIIGLKKRGDTLQYNLKAYKSGTEQTLGDVIKTLPGMDVSADGDVEVKGKKADALLIEGKEVINKEHKLATEGMQADIVKSVELINNYRTRKEIFLDEKESDKTAVNIKLTDEAKMIWTGNINGHGGYKNKIKTGLNLFNIRDDKGITIFGRQNNIGDQLLRNPFQKNENTDSKFGIVSNKNFFSSAEKEDNSDVAVNQFSHGLISNSDYQVSINMDNRFSKKTHNKLFVTGGRLNRKNSQRLETEYNTTNIYQEKTSTATKAFSQIYLHNKTSIAWNRKHFTDIKIPLGYTDIENRFIEVGSFNSEPLNQNIAKTNKYLRTQPSINHSIRFSKAWSSTITQKLVYKNRDKDNIFDSYLSFLSITPEADSIYRLNYLSDYNHTSLQSSFYVQRKHTSGYISFNGNYRWENKKEIYSGSKKTPLQSYGEHSLKNQIFKNKIKFQNDTKLSESSKIRYSLQTEYASIKQNSSNISTTSDWNHFLLPSIFLLFEHSKSHNISFSYMKKVEHPDFQHFNRIYIIESPNFIETGGLSYDNMRKTTYYTLSFFDKDISKTLSYNVNLSLGEAKQYFINENNTIKDAVSAAYTTIPGNKNISIYTGLMSSFRKWNIRFSSLFNERNSYLKVGGEFEEINTNRLEHRIKLSSTRWKNVSLAIELRHLRNTRKYNNRRYLFQNYSIKSFATWKHKRLQYKLSYLYSYQKNESSKNHNNILDIKLTFKQNKSWSYFLSANNLLNLKSNTSIHTTYTPTYQSNISFSNFPGQIMVGLGYYF